VLPDSSAELRCRRRTDSTMIARAPLVGPVERAHADVVGERCGAKRTRSPHDVGLGFVESRTPSLCCPAGQRTRRLQTRCARPREPSSRRTQ
jgi:hypothetical protein